jgi:hypothetical protein
MFERLFRLAIEICSYSLCRAFDDGSFKKNLDVFTSYAEIYAKQKSLPNIFIMLRMSTTMWVVRIEYGKIIKTSQQEFLYTVVVELFTGHFLKKYKILLFSQAEIYTK